MINYIKSKSYLYFYNLFQLAELVEEGAVGEEEGNGEGEDGGSDAAYCHVEHQDEGVDGAHTTEEDTAQQ